MELYNVWDDEVKRSFEASSAHLNSMRSNFVWDGDETRNSARKRQGSYEVIISKKAQPMSVSVTQEGDESQWTTFTVISEFRASILVLFITKSKMFEEARFTNEQLYDGHGIRSERRQSDNIFRRQIES
jgi:hypothetical protein